MKKGFFLLGVGTLMLASCAQEEVIKTSSDKAADGAITFTARAGKASRADGSLLKILKHLLFMPSKAM